MRIEDIKKINRRYDERLKAHGEGIKALASGTEARRDLRFGVLAAIGALKGKRILDLGCGFADFNAYLLDRGVKTRYTGWDINPKLIEACRRRFPRSRFAVQDIQKLPIPRVPPFDYVVCSQAFNFELGARNEALVRDVLKRSYALAAEGVALDLLSTHVDFREKHLHYYDPSAMLRFAKTLTKRVTLRHDYPLYEFCLYLYRDFHGWKRG